MASEQVGPGRHDVPVPPLRTDEDLLHHSHQELIRASCFKTLGWQNGHHLDDAVQDTNYKALGGLRKGTLVRDSKAWLASIARNASLNILRTETKHRPPNLSFEGADSRDIDEEASDQGWFSSCIFETPQVKELLLNLSRQLTARQREVLVLALDGHSQKDIARALGISRALVNKEIQYIRKILLMPDPDGDGSGNGNGRMTSNGEHPERISLFLISSTEDACLGDPMGALDLVSELKLAEQLRIVILDLPVFRECLREIDSDSRRATKAPCHIPELIKLTRAENHHGCRKTHWRRPIDVLYRARAPD